MQTNSSESHGLVVSGLVHSEVAEALLLRCWPMQEMDVGEYVNCKCMETFFLFLSSPRVSMQSINRNNNDITHFYLHYSVEQVITHS